MPLPSAGPERVQVRELTSYQLKAVAEVHCAAFPDSALSGLGVEAVRRYYEWQLTGPQQSVGLGAFVDGELGGFCVGGVFRRKMSGYLQRNRWFLLSQLARHPGLVLRRRFRGRLVDGLRILRLLPRPSDGVGLYQDSDPRSFGILAVAVHPRHQGLGLGRMLMTRAEAVARQRGFRRMNLSVHVDNEQAIRFYERLDWQRRLCANDQWRGEMTKWLSR